MELIRVGAFVLALYLVLCFVETAMQRFPAWQRVQRRLRRWPQPPGVDAWSIEEHARYLVQKIARLEAARQALRTAEQRPVRTRTEGEVVFLVEDLPITFRELERLRRRVEDADRVRSYALVDLRLALGLPEDPTQAECGIWGEAP